MGRSTDCIAATEDRYIFPPLNLIKYGVRLTATIFNSEAHGVGLGLVIIPLPWTNKINRATTTRRPGLHFKDRLLTETDIGAGCGIGRYGYEAVSPSAPQRKAVASPISLML